MRLDGPDEFPEYEFPLDGAAELSASVWCPYCGEEMAIGVDPSGGRMQEYVEDCQVCCKPWLVRVHLTREATAQVTLEPADG